MTAMITTPWRAFGPAMELGEGARWIEGSLVQVDLLAGRLYRTDSVGDELRSVTEPGLPLGAVAPVSGRPGQWIGAAGTGVVLFESGSTTRWIAHLDDASVPIRVNDGACDPEGRFWAGVMAYDPSPEYGALYCIDRDHSVARVLSDIAIPNGPVFNAAGTVMYLADSAVAVIYQFTVGAGGELSDRREFASVDGAPDGMTVDADDHVWSAIWGAGAVHRYTPSGALAEVVTLPAAQPTSVAVGSGRMWVTSASHGLERPSSEDGRTFVVKCAVVLAAAVLSMTSVRMKITAVEAVYLRP